MRRIGIRCCSIAIALSLTGASIAAHAQSTIPTRALGPVFATAAESDTVRPATKIHALSNGSVIANDNSRPRILFFDSTLKARVAVSSELAFVSDIIIAYRGDSTLVPDYNSRVLLVLGPTGKIERSMSFPHAAVTFGTPGIGSTHVPAIDGNGRLLYQSAFPGKPFTTEFGPTVAMQAQISADSAPILRADFDTRTIDTIGVVKVSTRNKLKAVTRTPNGNVLRHPTFTPFVAASDEWVVTTDGSLALVRANDYHIDWVTVDNRKQTSPKLPMEWKRITDDEKQKLIDSVRIMVDSANPKFFNASLDVPPNGRPPRAFDHFEVPTLDDLPNYITPFYPGTVIADRENRIWIPPRTTIAVKGSVTYDVINRDGVIVERVLIPEKHRLLGFISRDVAVLGRIDSQTRMTLRLARVR